MITLAYVSRETVERIFYYSTALDDLLERVKSSPYNTGDYLSSVKARDLQIKNNLRDRKAITNVCRLWHDVGLKYRCELLVVDSKCSESWEHVAQTFKRFGLGRHVRRLHLDAFDSSIVRIKSAIKILRQCVNVKFLSLTFADDCRKHSPTVDLLMFAIRSAGASALEHLDCNFGPSFEQGTLLASLNEFPNLRTLYFHSTCGLDPIFDLQPLHMASLRNLKLAITKDKSLNYLSSCHLPSLEDLSIFQLHSVTAPGNRRFFQLHGSKLRYLQLTYFVEGVSNLLRNCVNLEELVLSLDGFRSAGGEISLFHHTVLHIGIRDTCVNSVNVCKIMDILRILMRKFTSSILFPSVRAIRLLDFHQSLLVNLSWERNHVELWKYWVEMCGNMLIALQGADGKQLSVGSIRLAPVEDDKYWLSMPH